MIEDTGDGRALRKIRDNELNLKQMVMIMMN